MEDLTAVIASKIVIGDALGRLDGRIREIECKRDTYVEEAVTFFNLAVAADDFSKRARDLFEKL